MADNQKQVEEHWGSKLGVILAVAGSAVGFGNFLRFPGLAAEYGGGAFMMAYFISLLMLGIPLCWMEWAIGRHAGRFGCHSVVSAYQLLTKSPFWRYAGIVCMMTPLVLVMYYLYVEGWTLGYAYHCLVGDLHFTTPAEYSNFFAQFTGIAGDGAAFDLSQSKVLVFFGISLLINIALIYGGVHKGIEWFCKWSIPTLLILAVVIMVRVLTMGTPDSAHPERNVNEGLGYMWNPHKVVLQVEGKTVEMLPAECDEKTQAHIINKIQINYPDQEIKVVDIGFVQGLLNPELWVAAAGQIFFSLSVGFGCVLTYASYVKKDEDIALSAIAANAANEITEVSIAGLMIVPAAVSFLGVAAAAGAGTFGLGFEVLPQVFAAMPAGRFFGFIFFFLLYMAAITSSISQIQPAKAFLEEYWNLSRNQSISILIGIICVGTFIVIWYTGGGLMAQDTLDFFFGTLTIYFSCTIMLLVCTRFWKPNNILNELDHGALIRVPRSLGFVLSWLTPALLIFIFFAWIYKNIFVETSTQVQRVLDGEMGAIIPLLFTLVIYLFFAYVLYSSKRHLSPETEQAAKEQ